MATAAAKLQVGRHSPSRRGSAGRGRSRQVLGAVAGRLIVQGPGNLSGRELRRDPREVEAHWIAGAVTAASRLPACTAMIPATMTAAPKI